MALPETRMKLAVRMVVRALGSEPEPDIARRAAMFRTAYAAVEASARRGTDEAWMEDTLTAAWDLVGGAWPDGGDIDEIAAGLMEAHAQVSRVAKPPATQPRRTRRDS